MVARATIVLAVAGLTVFIMWQLVLRKELPHPTTPQSAVSSTAPTVVPPQEGVPPPVGSVAVPLTDQQEKTAARESARAPFYNMLVNQSNGDVLDAEVDPAQPANLIVHMAVSSPQQASEVISQLIVPYAEQYGFNHALIYAPQDAGGGGHYRLAEEVDHPAQGAWQTFIK